MYWVEMKAIAKIITFYVVNISRGKFDIFAILLRNRMFSLIDVMFIYNKKYNLTYKIFGKKYGGKYPLPTEEDDLEFIKKATELANKIDQDLHT